MHHKPIRIKAAKTDEMSDDQELTRKRRCLPFMRSSKPAKRCPSPDIIEPSGKETNDPFSHLVPYTANAESNQSIDSHSDAYRRLGSLSGQRVSRHNPSSSIDAIVNQASKITSLPSWDKLVSKKRGGKKKQQKKNTGGAWRNVDEHVAQLKRKAVCLDRSIDNNSKQQPIKVEKAESAEPCDSRWNFIHNFIPVSRTKDLSLPKEELFDVKSVSTVPQLPTVTTKSKVKSSLVNMDSEGPAWKPAPVVGKMLETSSNIQPAFQTSWLDKLDQDTQNVFMESASSHPFQSTQSSSTSAASPVNQQSSSSFKLVVTELSFQTVPGSEPADMNRHTSPWPDMWSPSPPTDKSHEE